MRCALTQQANNAFFELSIHGVDTLTATSIRAILNAIPDLFPFFSPLDAAPAALAPFATD
jgi:hypothetical protein